MSVDVSRAENFRMGYPNPDRLINLEINNMRTSHT